MKIWIGFAKKQIFLTFLIMVCNSKLHANKYLEDREETRDMLIQCMRAPDPQSKSPFGDCVLKTSDQFLEKARAQFIKKYHATNDLYEREKLVSDSKIYQVALKNCDIFQNLTNTKGIRAPICRLQVSRAYLTSLINENELVPDSWTLEDRVDRFYIGY